MTIQVDNVNFLRPHDFQLVVEDRDFRGLSYYCQSVTLPGMSVQAVGNIRHSRAQIAVGGDSITFDQFSVSFKIDENMANYIAMYGWLTDIINEDEAQNKDLRVLVYNSNEKVSNEIVVYSAVPVTLSPIDMNLAVSSVDPVLANMSFAADRIEIVPRL